MTGSLVYHSFFFRLSVDDRGARLHAEAGFAVAFANGLCVIVAHHFWQSIGVLLFSTAQILWFKIGWSARHEDQECARDQIFFHGSALSWLRKLHYSLYRRMPSAVMVLPCVVPFRLTEYGIPAFKFIDINSGAENPGRLGKGMD